MPNVLPDALEAGTVNAVGFAGLLAAIDARESGWHENEAALTKRLLGSLGATDGVTLRGPGVDAERTPVVLFSVDGACPREIGRELDERFGVCVRGGTHCAPLLHQAIGTGEAGAVRVSPGWASTEAEVDLFIRGIETIVAERRVAGASR
tara:strand:+ start:47 stop:496 length:450 start_codon:yes stop_codon:yes gene_type:complete